LEEVKQEPNEQTRPTRWAEDEVPPSGRSYQSLGGADKRKSASEPIGRPRRRMFGEPRRAIPAEGVALAEVRVRERNYRRALAIADMLAASGSVILAVAVISGDSLRPTFLLVMPLIAIAAKLQGLYDRDELVLAKGTLDELPKLLNLATLFALLLWLSRGLIIKGTPDTYELLTLWALLAGSLTVGRMVARRLAGLVSPIERCLLLGDESVFRRVRSKVGDLPHLELVGSLPLELIAREPAKLQQLVTERNIQRVIVAPNQAIDGDDTIEIVRAAKATGLRVSLLPSILVAVGSSVVFDDVHGLTLLGVPRFGLTRSSYVVKRGFDVFMVVVMLPVAIPFIALVGLLIRLDSPGPVLFRQTRVGRDNERFAMYKLRTMVANADDLKSELSDLNEAEGLFKIADDPRITRVGKWLRRSHLDELPQLLNVLKGEMSIVGPRPLIVDEDERVTGFDRRRLQLTPGITGQWQILGPSSVPLNEMVKLDYLYVANWSLWGDVKILARTLLVVVGRRGM
jgi:exopolysaccharide biosynthesis polyprenyl glycosylphosphotransferase